MKAAWETIIAFKLVWFRTAMYFALPAANLFLSQTETFSDETWIKMGMFLKGRLIVQCIVAGLLSLVAFIDQSMARAKQELAAKRSGDTIMINKSDVTP